MPLEAVPLPPAAYGPFDAGVARAVAPPRDAGRPHDEEIVCEPQLEEDAGAHGSVDDEIAECLATRGGARLNRPVTRTRRRGEPTACCYGGWDASRKRGGVIRVDEME